MLKLIVENLMIERKPHSSYRVDPQGGLLYVIIQFTKPIGRKHYGRTK